MEKWWVHHENPGDSMGKNGLMGFDRANR
jgi:hypothetical protein